jgi:hypothetical protein
MKPTESEVHQAISIILSDTPHFSTSLNWAVNYCRSAMLHQGDELASICLRILGNITHWRHPEAKAVRSTLKAFSRSS